MAERSTDGILVRLMKVEDYEEAKILLGNSFYPEEPLSVCLGKRMEQVHTKENDEYLKAMIRDGTCFVAVDENNGNRIVGVNLAETHTPSNVEANRQRAKKAGHILKFHSKLEVESNIFERYKVSKAMYLLFICVSADMRGKGLSSRLINALMDVARDRGFPLLTACCSSFYASRQMQSMGMECAYSMPFSDYKDDKGKVIFQPPAPHTHVTVMIARL